MAGGGGVFEVGVGESLGNGVCGVGVRGVWCGLGCILIPVGWVCSVGSCVCELFQIVVLMMCLCAYM